MKVEINHLEFSLADPEEGFSFDCDAQGTLTVQWRDWGGIDRRMKPTCSSRTAIACACCRCATMQRQSTGLPRRP